jgi:hypothetical protein
MVSMCVRVPVREPTPTVGPCPCFNAPVSLYQLEVCECACNIGICMRVRVRVLGLRVIVLVCVS